MSIESRDVRFDFPDDTPSHWSPHAPEISHLTTAFMAALPYLEPYFIHNLREALPLLHDAALQRAAKSFIQQEARHAQQHRSWNQLIARRYRGFHALERALKTRLARSKHEHSLAFRLAYTAGYEALTYQLVCFAMRGRARWFQEADPNVLAMLSWHAAEEVEHKSVAFDVFNAVHGGYALRSWAFLVAFWESGRDIYTMFHQLLRADGLSDDPASRRRLVAVRIALLTELLPELAAYLLPGYHPDQHKDPAVMLGWLQRYHAGADLRRIDLAELDAMERGAAENTEPRTKSVAAF
jgi:predicted metal-dependent hydrolase